MCNEFSLLLRYKFPYLYKNLRKRVLFKLNNNSSSLSLVDSKLADGHFDVWSIEDFLKFLE